MWILLSCASETRSPEGDSKRMFSMASSRVAVLRQIAHHQIVALLALQHLRQRVAADRGLNGILHIRDIDLIAGRFCRSTVRFRLGWPITRKTPRS